MQALEHAERRGLAFVGQDELVPAEFLFLSGKDPRAEDGSQRLGAEADAHRRRVLLHNLFDELHLILQKRIAIELVNADRAAKDEDKVRIERWRKIVASCLEIGQPNAALVEHGAERTRALKGHVVDRDGILHNGLPIHERRVSIAPACKTLLPFCDTGLFVCDIAP